MTGSMPEQVDHINRNKEYNRWENLRATNNSLNQANTVSKRASGFKRVRKRGTRWEASTERVEKGIRKYYYLGLYKTFEDACLAVEAKSRELWGEHWRNK